MCRTVCLALALFSICCSAAPFANLGFELANTNNVSPLPGSGNSYLSGSGSVEELLPRWQLSYGSRSLSKVYLNLLARDPWAVSLISSDAQTDHSFVFPGGFEGKFALGFTVDATPFTLTQTGQIPEDATLLTLRVPRQPGTRVEARLNGRLVLSDTGSAEETADISAFAGQTAELEIRIWQDQLSGFGPYVGLDTVTFGVPEPRARALWTMAALLAACWRFWNGGRSSRPNAHLLRRVLPTLSHRMGEGARRAGEG